MAQATRCKTVPAGRAMDAPHRLLPVGRDPPDRIPKIVGDEQSSAFVDGQTYRPPARVIVGTEETRHDVLRRPAARSPRYWRHGPAAEQNELFRAGYLFFLTAGADNANDCAYEMADAVHQRTNIRPCNRRQKNFAYLPYHAWGIFNGHSRRVIGRTERFNDPMKLISSRVYILILRKIDRKSLSCHKN
jgi:hypothetical protein